MRAQYAAADLSVMNIPELPGTEKGVRIRADREAWPFVEVPARGRNGTRREYPVATLPAPIRAAILQQHTQSLSLTVTESPAALPVIASPDAAQATAHDRAIEHAKRLVLGALDALQADAGCPREAAITALITNARAGRIAPETIDALKLARDARGRKSPDGLPSPRSLKRWLSDRAHGVSLLPRKPQADMRVKPWYGLALSLKQRPQGGTVRWVHEELCKQWREEWGDAPSYHVVAAFFREKFSKIDVLVGRHNGMDMQKHRRYNVRSRDGLVPAQEAHADGWCTHFTAPHPVSGEFVTFEVWTATDYATGYPADPAIGMTESFEVIAKCLENYIRAFGVPAIFQTDSTGSVKNDRFEFDPITSLQSRIGFTIAHPKMLDVGKGNSQANGLAENLHAFYDREARELATYQGKDMDSLALKRVKRLTAQMVRAAQSGDMVTREKSRREAERMGKGIVFDTFDEACAWMLRVVQKRRDMPNRALPKIRDAATGKLRHMSPAECLEEFRADGWEPVAMSEAHIIDAFRPHVKKRVTRGGVTPYAGQRYDSPELEHHNGEDVMVAIDIMDWRRVWIKDMAGRLICEAQYLEGRSPRPRSLYETAFEKREKAAIKRRESQIDAIEQRNPFAVIDAPAEPVIDIAMQLYGDAPQPVTEPALRLPEPAEVTPEPTHHHNDITDIAMYLYGDQVENDELKKAAGA